MKNFYNYLTTPTGRYCELRELKNEDYLILNKFAESNNIKGFFEALDSLIINTIPDFHSFTLYDKFYVYLAFTAYSIKPSITITNANSPQVEIPISLIADNVETNYQDEFFIYRINDNISLEFGPPTNALFTIEGVQVDYLSGLRKVIQGDSELTLNQEQKDELIQKLPNKVLIEASCRAQESLHLSVDLFRGFDNSKYTIDAFSDDVYSTIFTIIPEKLESYYWRLFAAIHYVKMSQEGFMQMTPIETNVLLKNFQTVQEEQRKANEKGGGAVGGLNNFDGFPG